MAAHAMRYPPAPRRRWPARILGVLATAAFLGIGVQIALMVMPEPEQEAAVGGTTPAPAPSTTVEKPAGLTKAQKSARRAAVRTLTEQGYEPVRLGDWRPRNDLRVLVGRSDTGAMRAFFFVKREFVGNDDASSSTKLRVAKVGDESVTLAYGVSTGGNEKVKFEWVDGSLKPTGGTIPPSTVR